MSEVLSIPGLPVTERPRMTERDLLDLLNTRYAATYRNGTVVGRRYSRAEHVPNAAGFASGGERIADYIALDTYMPPYEIRTETEKAARRGLNGSIHGHEIKTSRSDWLTELADPTKAEAWARHCHHWWLVAPAEVVRDDLPDGWGWIVPVKNGLRVRVQAPRRDPEPLPTTTLVSLARAITKTEIRLAKENPND